MISIIKRETAGLDLKAIVDKLIPETLGKEIEKGCDNIYPLKDVYIRKVCLMSGFVYAHIGLRALGVVPRGTAGIERTDCRLAE